MNENTREFDVVAYQFLQAEGFCEKCGHESHTLDAYRNHRCVERRPEPVDAFDLPGAE
jgi:hypothetical protein